MKKVSVLKKVKKKIKSKPPNTYFVEVMACPIWKVWEILSAPLWPRVRDRESVIESYEKKILGSSQKIKLLAPVV